MLCALSYHAGDAGLASNLSDWIFELGGCKSHDLLLLRDRGANSLTASFARSFQQVRDLTVVDPYRRWPESPNACFKTAAKFIQYSLKAQSFFWFEPDAIPVRAGWLDALAAEYLAARVPFVGDFVQGVEDTPDHMSGIGFYPGNIPKHAGNAVIAHEVPWDIEAASQIRGKVVKFTELIQHNWRPPEFTSLEIVRAELDPRAVLYHKDKTGNLIQLLRAERSGGVAKLADASDLKSDGEIHEGSNPSAPTNLPVPVLAEPTQDARNPALVALEAGGSMDGEARESNHQGGPMPEKSDSRGGQFISAQEATASTPAVASQAGAGLPDMADGMRFLGPLAVEPWHAKDDSIRSIQELCAELKRYCNAPLHTATVRKELKKAKVTK